MFNRVGAGLRGLGFKIAEFDPDRIEAAARRQAGFDNFGSPFYRTPLQKLCECYRDDSDLTFIGRLFCHGTLLHLLTNRLLIQKELQANPAIAQENVRRPLFVLGLPRTGTTFLFNLLSQDPACRPLMYWESMRPAPSPRPETYQSDSRLTLARRHVRRLKRALPDLEGIHPFDADHAEECVGLLMNSFFSPFFGGHIPSFRQWYYGASDAEVMQVYAEHRTQLQILQRHVKGDHWILKCPTHCFAIGEVLKTSPDAAVVMTHRDLSRCVPSLCSLLYVYYQLCYPTIDRGEIGRVSAEIAEQLLNRSMRSRDQVDPAGERVLDIDYSETTRDPLGTVERIYRRFGYDFTPEFEARVKKYLAEDTHAKGPRHTYTLEEFGLTPEDLNNRFGAYTARFHLAPDVKAGR